MIVSGDMCPSTLDIACIRIQVGNCSSGIHVSGRHVSWCKRGIYRQRRIQTPEGETRGVQGPRPSFLVRLKADIGQGIQEWSYTTTRLRYPQPGGSSPQPWSTAWRRTVNEAARYTDCKQLLLPTTPTTADQIHCRQRSHISADIRVCADAIRLL